MISIQSQKSLAHPLMRHCITLGQANRLLERLQRCLIVANQLELLAQISLGDGRLTIKDRSLLK